MAVEFQWPSSAVAHCAVRQNLISSIRISSVPLHPAPLPSLVYHVCACVRVLCGRASPPVSSVWLCTLRATFSSCATSSRGSSFFEPPSAISADGGGTQHRLYYGLFYHGFPHLSHIVIHTSEPIEWIMNGCPVKSSEVCCGCSVRTLRSPSF